MGGIWILKKGKLSINRMSVISINTGISDLAFEASGSE
jgi:hypothetical protein